MEEKVLRERIKVLVRIRPVIETESDRKTTAVVRAHESKPEVIFEGSEARHQLRCAFDHVLGPTATQEAVYEHVADCATQVASGYNATILAYGQTSSGKTHTMFGPPGWRGGSEAGLIPRAVDALFGAITTGHVYASFVQIYREQVYDMLRDPTRSTPLEIRLDDETGGGANYVSGLSEYAVRSAQDCMQLLKAGEDNRAVRETHMNTASSRSHSIFTVLIEQKRVEGDGESTLRSKFNLVDLAGSEKWDIYQTMVEDRVAEMTNINKSLHTLGKCIAALAKAAKDPGTNVHVPYRDSKLTRLLQDSLGGNSITRLIATLSPAADCIDESVSTLRFADRARSVTANVRRNEHRPIDYAMVQRLQSEVVRLRAMLQSITRDAKLDGGFDLERLLNELERLKIENRDLRARLLPNNNNKKNDDDDKVSITSFAGAAKKNLLPALVPDARAPHPDRRSDSPLDRAAKYRRLVQRNTKLEAALTSALKKPPEPDRASLLAAEARAAAGPKYRVRQGRQSRTGGDWIDPEVEREEALKRELRETKARMRKHAQTREWLVRKSEQENEMLRREEEEREAARQLAADKEAKYRRRAEKQKRKLRQYYDQLHAEVRRSSSPLQGEPDDAFGRKLQDVVRASPIDQRPPSDTYYLDSDDLPKNPPLHQNQRPTNHDRGEAHDTPVPETGLHPRPDHLSPQRPSLAPPPEEDNRDIRFF
ncbi:hypothetical protein CTAYLR_001327 [Chrysophaeum taylorii]|uniref:Kinesin-like protein n=1 Tax=Chrysophaeum taylorii TaxID=2483200 RepID=A0AAD7XHG6_9STRA|nr:hypothetical protein CTAYLR_001327 [Chrysophaeum taylorii]